MDAPMIATSLAEYINSNRSLKWSERTLSDGDGVIVDLAPENDLSNLEAMLVILQVMISKADITQDSPDVISIRMTNFGSNLLHVTVRLHLSKKVPLKKSRPNLRAWITLNSFA
jgi:hypothetical protein